jgi:hypothetical protein
VLTRHVQPAPAADFSIRDHVTGVLSASQFEDKRSSKLDIEDFLRLLQVFNDANVHFA